MISNGRIASGYIQYAGGIEMSAAETKVGYKRPPVHTRFKPGQSGNPGGRPTGSQNLKTMFDRILNEKVSLREGDDVRKITKAEAIMRGLVVSAMRGDSRSIATLLRLAEQSGQFEEGERQPLVIIRRFADDLGAAALPALPDSNDINRD
jgi:hypothetical protein